MRTIFKLAAALLAGIALVLAAVLILQVQREAALFQDDMVADDSFIGRRLATAAEAVRRTQGETAADQFLRDADLGASNVHVRHATEPLPPQTGPAPLNPALRPGESCRFDAGGTLHVLVPIRSELGPFGAVEITEDSGPERRYLRATIWRHVATAGAITVVCGAVSIILGAMIVGAPVTRMIGQARRIGAGDLSARLAPRGRDELAQLAREIDAMCDQLSLARERLSAETTARIEALEQLRRADRLATVGKLASGIAHELGTPLNVVSARAKMVATGEQQGDEARDAARTISDQTARMTRIIRQLLDFARPRRPAREPADLAALARQAALLLAPIASARSVTIASQEPPAPVGAQVDPSQIQQVLSNLIVNAVHASPAGAEVTLSTGTERARPPADLGGAEAPHAFLRIADRGRGIPPQDIVHLFEPFFTTKDVGEGTGLGLSISSGIVREHGGWIDVRSTPGEGSVFTVYLPCGNGS